MGWRPTLGTLLNSQEHLAFHNKVGDFNKVGEFDQEQVGERPQAP